MYVDICVEPRLAGSFFLCYGKTSTLALLSTNFPIQWVLEFKAISWG